MNIYGAKRVRNLSSDVTIRKVDNLIIRCKLPDKSDMSVTFRNNFMNTLHNRDVKRLLQLRENLMAFRRRLNQFFATKITQPCFYKVAAALCS